MTVVVGIIGAGVMGADHAHTGSFRFDKEFALAVDLIGSGRINVEPLLSDTLPLAEAKRAFQLAGDKSKTMKVQIAFD